MGKRKLRLSIEIQWKKFQTNKRTKQQDNILNLNEKLKRRNIGIDLLRGFSILTVLLLHLNIHFGFSNTFLKEVLPNKLFSFLFWSGFYGVVVFFTLSGFLITNSILKKWGELSKIDLKTFYWFRFSRIIPLLLLLLIILSILHVTNTTGFVINPERTSLGRAIFSTLTFHINWLEIQVGYLPANWDVLWSISIEETFYLVFPLVCIFLKKEWQFVIILIIFLIISPWARTQLYPDSELGSKNHFAFLDAIAFGCMTAIIAYRIHIPNLLNKFFLFIGWSLIILVFVFKSVVYKSGLVGLGLDMTIQTIGVSLVLLWMHAKQHTGKQKNRLVLNGLRRMGIYSYEIYLTHMFCIVFGVKIFKNLNLTEQWIVPFSILLIFLSFFIGKITFKYFSEPINLRLRKIMNKTN